MSADSPLIPDSSSAPRAADIVPPLVAAIGAAAYLTLLAPNAWLVLLTDGALSTAVVAAATGWGAWPAVWLGFRRRSAMQQTCVAAALGLGILATATLALGVAAALNRPVAWGLVIVGGVLGLARIQYGQGQRANTGIGAAKQGRGAPETACPEPRPGLTAAPVRDLALRSLVLLTLAVPAGIMLFGATLPPGVLWNGEARGYDVLEYHLQAPKEHYEAGRIHFLPHNVYAQFPQQMESLYLLLMHLAGGPYEAAIAAQILHALCGILTVLALAAWAPPGWPRIVVAVVAGSVPWLAYLGCLAYVELGMLFFAAVAAGVLLDRFGPSNTLDWRSALTAGVCAGLACGCKYTAVVLVAAGLGVAWFLTVPQPVSARLRGLAIYGIAALLTFSPWLVRNAVWTGNPVYPFVFGGANWSPEQAEQWQRGHALPEEAASLAGRAQTAFRELLQWHLSESGTGLGRIRTTLFGSALFVLGVLGLILSRSRPAWMLMIWSVLVFVSWALWTHMPGRFAVPLIVPMALLAGQTLRPAQRVKDPEGGAGPRKPTLRTPIVVLAVIGATLNAGTLARLLVEHDRFWMPTARQTGSSLPGLVGFTDGFVEADELNRATRPDAHILLVGRANVFYIARRLHYTVVFSRDEWLEFARDADARVCLDWLRTRGVTHVSFSWSEIDRLAGTYGFAKIVTREWVRELEGAGLRRIRPTSEPASVASSELYEVPQE